MQICISTWRSTWRGVYGIMTRNVLTWWKNNSFYGFICFYEIHPIWQKYTKEQLFFFSFLSMTFLLLFIDKQEFDLWKRPQLQITMKSEAEWSKSSIVSVVYPFNSRPNNFQFTCKRNSANQDIISQAVTTNFLSQTFVLLSGDWDCYTYFSYQWILTFYNDMTWSY